MLDCKKVLLEGLLEALEEGQCHVEKISKNRFGDRSISAISFEIYPWHQYIAISLRTEEERLGENSGIPGDCRYSPADWQHFEYVASHTCRSQRFQKAANHITDFYENADSHGVQPIEAAHLIFWAAAEALIDPKVAAILSEQSIDAPTLSDCLGGNLKRGAFDYLVFDVDQSIRANYCEIVLAHRIRERFLKLT